MKPPWWILLLSSLVGADLALTAIEQLLTLVVAFDLKVVDLPLPKSIGS